MPVFKIGSRFGSAGALNFKMLKYILRLPLNFFHRDLLANFIDTQKINDDTIRKYYKAAQALPAGRFYGNYLGSFGTVFHLLAEPGDQQ